MPEETVEPRQIKASEIAGIKEEIMRVDQRYFCPLCGRNLMTLPSKSRCLDHDHRKTTPNAGGIRGVLCSNCNGMDGQIFNRAVRAACGKDPVAWLERHAAYLRKHETNQTGMIHPTHGKPVRRKKRVTKDK